MSNLTPESIRERFDIVYDKLTEGLDPLTKMAITTMRPKCEALLCEEEGRNRLFSLMELLTHCMGYNVFFVPEFEIEYINYIKAGQE